MDEPSSTAQQRTGRPLRGLDRYRSQIALVAGLVAAGMGLLARLSFGYLGNDEFGWMFFTFLASSFLAWLAALLSASLSVLSIRDGRLFAPLTAISLSCFGLGIIVFTVMPDIRWFLGVSA